MVASIDWLPGPTSPGMASIANLEAVGAVAEGSATMEAVGWRKLSSIGIGGDRSKITTT